MSEVHVSFHLRPKDLSLYLESFLQNRCEVAFEVLGSDGFGNRRFLHYPRNHSLSEMCTSTCYFISHTVVVWLPTTSAPIYSDSSCSFPWRTSTYSSFPKPQPLWLVFQYFFVVSRFALLYNVGPLANNPSFHPCVLPSIGCKTSSSPDSTDFHCAVPKDLCNGVPIGVVHLYVILGFLSFNILRCSRFKLLPPSSRYPSSPRTLPSFS